MEGAKRNSRDYNDARTDRQASHKASDLPIPGWRLILNAVNTAGTSLRDRQTVVRKWN